MGQSLSDSRQTSLAKVAQTLPALRVGRWTALHPSGTVPSARSGHTGAVDKEGRLWIYGGYFEGGGQRLGYNEVSSRDSQYRLF